MLARLEDSALIVVDMQPTFLGPVWEGERVLGRCRFIAECARLLGVPILVTEQYPERMGGTEPGLLQATEAAPIAKMSFSCLGEKEFRKAWKALDREQAVIVGIETHICVTQTAYDLLEDEVDVIVCLDAVSARSEDRHKAAVKRMRDEGAGVAHTESVVYEWMQSAEHDRFRDVLAVVKRFTG
ncbi:MAG: isochorismatase family protein [Fimbriimonadaceae bacterium]|nr:isochorismatase family protein [Fimbriimonadaceae bacterium]QYK57856.1 MAG: isochorismatase family protein [Fimbriimonadaceae bacterium]